LECSLGSHNRTLYKSAGISQTPALRVSASIYQDDFVHLGHSGQFRDPICK
jgi:hypothetical protein